METRFLNEQESISKIFLNEYQELYHIISDEFIIFDSNGTVDDAIYLYKKIQERTLDFIESTNYEIYYSFQQES